MDELIANIIHKAEQLLDADKPEQARTLLASGLSKNPASAPLWWALSQAMEKVEQEVDCLERVLLYDPGHAQARRRLDELTTPLVPSPVPPVIGEPEPAEEALPSTFETFQPGDFEADQVGLSIETQFELDEASPAALDPNSSAQFLERSEVPVWAEPPELEEGNDSPPENARTRGRLWIMDVIIIATVLVAILVVVAYFWLKDIGRI